MWRAKTESGGDPVQRAAWSDGHQQPIGASYVSGQEGHEHADQQAKPHGAPTCSASWLLHKEARRRRPRPV